MQFTTRPEITGSFGVVTSTHWIATAVGMAMLERGGNAFDAAVATGLVLSVVEPHLNGPAGDMPAIFYKAGADGPTVLCAQGVAPAKATIDHYRDQGLDRIPGSGLLATVVPGAFDGWMLMLRDHGTLPLRDVLEPAIYYAREGHPILARACDAIAELAPFFAQEWPGSAALWTPGGAVPKPGSLFRNPDLAATWTRLLTTAEAATGREAQIDAARDCFYRGFIAEALGDYLDTTEAMDATGQRRKGVLSADDLANWSASYEAPLSYDYGDWTVHKTGPWGQGPVLLQALSILKGTDIAQLDPTSAEFVHLVIEAEKLAFADREAFYGDPDFADIPMENLLSDAYAETRRGLIGQSASVEQRPGQIAGYEDLADRMIARANETPPVDGGVGTGEPTMSHLTDARGDTVHLDVIDRWGNMVSVTPSGGWLQSSPIVPGLGMALNSRAQMFWLEQGLPTSLAPGRRPRTTLSPSLASFQGRPSLSFGTPGGDQQDQWQLVFFLRLAHGETNLQALVDAPLFHSLHFQGSFAPRVAAPGHMMIEPAYGEGVIADLRARGHIVEVAEPWSIGRLTAAHRDANGLLTAGATPRLMQAYAAGR